MKYTVESILSMSLVDQEKLKKNAIRVGGVRGQEVLDLIAKAEVIHNQKVSETVRDIKSAMRSIDSLLYSFN